MFVFYLPKAIAYLPSAWDGVIVIPSAKAFEPPKEQPSEMVSTSSGEGGAGEGGEEEEEEGGEEEGGGASGDGTNDESGANNNNNNDEMGAIANVSSTSLVGADGGDDGDEQMTDGVADISEDEIPINPEEMSSINN